MGLQPETVTVQSDLAQVYKYQMGRNEEGAIQFSATYYDRTGNGYKLKHIKFCVNARKYFFTCKGNQTLEQVAQRGCGASIYEDMQNLTGHSPVLGNLLWLTLLEQGVGLDDLKRSLPNSMIL